MEKETKKIVLLDGSAGGADDFVEHINESVQNENFEWDIEILDDLYNKPEKLKNLPEINPEFIFVMTTGLYKKDIERVRSKFNSLNWIPKNVLFSSGDYMYDATTGVFRNEIKQMGQKGTKFWLLGGYEGKLLKYGI